MFIFHFCYYFLGYKQSQIFLFINLKRMLIKLLIASLLILSTSSQSCIFQVQYFNAASNNCQRCPQYCGSCRSLTDCTSCISGYLLENNQCNACLTPDCGRCSDRATCTSCGSGFFLQSNTCIACQPYCVLCLNSTHCRVCDEKSYVDNSDGKCYKCPSSTYRCESSVKPTTCRYYKYYSLALPARPLKCIPCGLNCKVCNSTNCLGCDDNYFLQNNQCTSCPPNCERCSSSASCQACKSGYRKTSGQLCQACSKTKCLRCSNSPTQCTFCQQNYYPTTDSNGNVVCSPITIPYCRYQVRDNQCHMCFSNSLSNQVNNLCINPPIPNCKEIGWGITDGYQCGKCQDGYTSIRSKKQCVSTNGRPTSFLTCNDRQFQLKEVCVSCSPGCAKCLYATLCYQCDQGYFLVDYSYCSPCPPGCPTCTVSSTTGMPVCTTCTSPAQLSPTYGICIYCDPSCQTCSPDNPKNCLSCVQPKIVSNGACIANPACPIENCASCSSGVVLCTSCLPGFFLYLGSCLPCKYPCKECSYNLLSWETVSAFWIYALTTAYSITSTSTLPPGLVLPDFFNNLNFATMNDSLKRGWTEAALVAAVFNSSFPDNSVYYGSIPGHITFYLENSAKSLPQLMPLIINRFNTLTNKEWTLEQYMVQRNQIAASYLSICSNCADGFALNLLGACGPCSSGCSTCSSSAVCTTCLPGKYLSSGSCLSCSSTCATCSQSAIYCTSCIEPLSANQGRCVACNQPCATCDYRTPNICLTCKKPFLLEAQNGVCVKCNQLSCTKCYSLDPSLCLECGHGTYLLESVCKPCPNGCSKCLFISSMTICYQCSTGYQLNIVGLNVSCSICTPGCMSCSQGSCLQCQPGTYLNQVNGKCQLCRTGCSQCTNSDTCTVFSNGLTEINGYIITCGLGCQKCNGPHFCVSCSYRHYLQNGICRPCKSNCAQCTTGLDCLRCFGGYSLNSGNCVACNSNCYTCSSSPQTCTSCLHSYTLVSNTCQIKCESSCITCSTTDFGVCYNCKTGYTLSSGKCLQCTYGCSGTCDPKNVSSCLSCVEGFELSNNQCVKCPSGCTTCLNGQCSSCIFGYILKTDSITNSIICKQLCMPPCQQCQLKICTSCQYGYALRNGVCQPDLSCNPKCPYCPLGTQNQSGNCVICSVTGCAACISGQCLNCLPGFYLDSNTCIPCPSQCLTCYNQQSCIICAPGFVNEIVAMTTSIATAVLGERCIACNQNCLVCIIEPDRCIVCKDGTLAKGFRCIGMYNVNFRYELSLVYNSFMQSQQSQKVLQALSTLVNLDVSSVLLESIIQGSTIVSGTIQATGLAQATNVQSALGNSFPGYTVLSSSSAVYYGNSAYVSPSNDGNSNDGTSNDGTSNDETSNQNSSSQTNLGLFIGIGAGVLVVILIIVIAICIANSREEKRLSEMRLGKQIEIERSKRIMIKVEDSSSIQFDR